MLNLDGRFRHGDFTREFLLRCKENETQTLVCMGQKVHLQGMQPEQEAGAVQALVEAAITGGIYDR